MGREVKLVKATSALVFLILGLSATAGAVVYMHYQAYLLLAAKPPAVRVVYIVEAYQWGFSFNGTDKAVVPYGAEVTFLIYSTMEKMPGFAAHGFWILEFMDEPVEIPVGAKEPVRVTFIADKVGDFIVVCTVFCGQVSPTLGHTTMRATFSVIRP